MKRVIIMVAVAALVVAAAADEFVVGCRGTHGDYPFRGC